MPKNKLRGFTLVELMVVMAIVAILATVGMVSYSGIQRNARDAKRRGDLDNLAKAVSVYYAANRALPPSSCTTTGDWSVPFKTAMASYINQFGLDPQANNGSRHYCFSESATCGPVNSNCIGVGRPVVYGFLENCTDNARHTGDAASIGQQCNIYARMVETP